MGFETMPVEKQENKKKKGVIKKALAIATAGLISSQVAEAGNINIKKREGISSEKSTTIRMTESELSELQKKPEIRGRAIESFMQKKMEKKSISPNTPKTIEQYMNDLFVSYSYLGKIPAGSFFTSLQKNKHLFEHKIMTRIAVTAGMPTMEDDLGSYLQKAIKKGAMVTPQELESLARLAKI